MSVCPRTPALTLLALIFVVVGATTLCVPATLAQSLPDAPTVRYDDDYPDPAFHADRRQALIAALPESAYVVVPGAPTRRRENDVFYEYRASSDLYYLSGSTEPDAVLLLAPHGVRIDERQVREILFVPEATAFSNRWLGRRMGPEGAQAMLGIEYAMIEREFDHVLRAAVAQSPAPIYFLPPAGPSEHNSALERQMEAVLTLVDEPAEFRIRSNRLRQTLNRLRGVKQPEEMRLLQRAIDITAAAHRAAMRAASPGMHEYELEAIIEFVFKREGAEEPAFPSIVGSGENTTVLHYDTNRRQMDDGDMVVIDIGAEFRGYAADVTRSFPVNGVFTPEQRAIYQLVLDAQLAGIEASRAGNSFQAPHQAASLVIEAGLRDLGILRENEQASRYIVHGASHFLGLSVHDVDPGSGVLEAGNVITVEPGLYFEPAADLDSKWWYIGVRIEDDVLITDGDPVVLSADAPKTIEEIESWMSASCSLDLCAE